MDKKCKRAKQCWCKAPLKDRVTHFTPLLNKLRHAKLKERIKLLKNASTCFVRFLAECGLNILKENLQLDAPQYTRLKPHKQTLLSLSKPMLSLSERRDVLMKKKKGGFLPVFVPIVASALASFLGEAVAKAVGV